MAARAGAPATRRQPRGSRRSLGLDGGTALIAVDTNILVYARRRETRWHAEALSLLKLVSLAGGFTKYAAPARATLIRRNGDKKVLLKIDLKDVMNDQALRARLSELGVDPVWDEASTIASAIAADLMRWGQLARVAKIEAPQ